MSFILGQKPKLLYYTTYNALMISLTILLCLLNGCAIATQNHDKRKPTDSIENLLVFVKQSKAEQMSSPLSGYIPLLLLSILRNTYNIMF